MIEIPGSRTARPLSGQVCGMLAVDIAGYTREDRDGEVRLYLRRALYQILQEAFEESQGLPWAECDHEDRGDGALVILPPHVSGYGIVDPLPDRMRALIRRHNRVFREPAQMQLRAAASIGPVDRDEHGFAGDDISMLFRMLEAGPLRKALASSQAELALAVSSYLHDNIVARHPSRISPALFRPLNARVKRTAVHAWMYVPGQPPP